LILNGSEDRIEHALEILEDLNIPEPQDAVALTGKPSVTQLVCGSIRSKAVLLTIEFDDQTRSMTHEIGDIPAHRDLPSHVQRLKAMGFQRVPKLALGRRQLTAETLGTATLSSIHMGAREGSPGSNLIASSLVGEGEGGGAFTQIGLRSRIPGLVLPPLSISPPQGGRGQVGPVHPGQLFLTGVSVPGISCPNTSAC
jgi:hypothetical protein